jgi:pilus assembly protein CpaD
MTRNLSFAVPSLAILAAAALLAGCATAPGTGPQSDPRSRNLLEAWENEVKVTAVPQDIRLAPHDGGLSVNQAAALEGFVTSWMQAEAREIVIRAPDAGPDARGANRVAWDARDRLMALGVRPSQIRMAAYDGAEPRSPVVLSYSNYVAQVPTCGTWRDLTKSGDNGVYDNFGCAVAANMAAQVANPEDLLGPREMTAADAQERGQMFEKYRKGAATGSARDEKANATVSQVVN